MNISEIKELLHKAVDDIEDENHLQALIDMLTQNESGNIIVLTEDQVKTLQEKAATCNTSDFE